MSSLLTKIRYLSQKHPLLSNCIIYSGICGAAEFTQQTIERRKNYDHKSVFRYTMVGAGGSPILHGYYKMLDKYLPGASWKIVGKKLLLDSIVAVPLYATFYIVMSYMEGKSNVLEECRVKFIPTYLVAMLYWVPMQAINFAFISPAKRILFIAFCTFGEINILCIFKRMDFD